MCIEFEVPLQHLTGAFKTIFCKITLALHNETTDLRNVLKRTVIAQWQSLISDVKRNKGK